MKIIHLQMKQLLFQLVKTIGTKSFNVINNRNASGITQSFSFRASLTNARFPANDMNISSDRVSKDIEVTFTEGLNVELSTNYSEVADTDYFEYTVTTSHPLSGDFRVIFDPISFPLAHDNSFDNDAEK